MPDTFQDPSTEEGFQDETVDITNAPSPKPLDLAISSKVWSDLSAPEIFLEPSLKKAIGERNWTSPTLSLLHQLMWMFLAGPVPTRLLNMKTPAAQNGGT